MKKDLQTKAIALRKEGCSINELYKILDVAKSTAAEWVKNVPLSKKAVERIKNQSTKGQLKAHEAIREKSKQKNLIVQDFSKKIVGSVAMDKNIETVLCSMIYHCEGAKSLSSLVAFTNSDPELIATFLHLFRNSFDVDEKKFRVLMHLHPYHSEKTQKDFWSQITGIPKEQFHKSYLKESSGTYKKEGYQGCIKVQYYDVSIARKLLSIAKSFMGRYK